MTEQESSSASAYRFAGRSLHSSSQQKGALSDDVGAAVHTKNVVVLGGSYGGMHAASVLAQRLPPSHRVILVERNSHFNHLYVFPRFSTLPGHEHKAFIPYASIFKDAPKRPAKGPLSSKNSSKQAGPKAPFTPSSQIPPSESRNKEMLGMGAMAGKDEKMLQSGPSSSSDTSEGSQSSIFRPRRRLNSSGSQSSSGGDDSVFDKDSLRSIRTAATSLSSSYVESSSSGVHRRTLAEKEKAAGSDASHYAMEDAIAAEALSGKAREEEDLGRPEIQVEDLDSALKKGIDLEGEVDDAEDVAHGFEDSSPHVVLQATVTNITSTHVIVQSNNAAAAQVTGAKKKLWSVDSVSIPYSHLVYALGSHLPDPLRTEARTKRDGISWMRDIQNRVKASQEIVLVGGGALGVEFASDIKSVHPEKKVTLIHSRMQLLPNFDKGVHDVALQTLQGLGVNVVLGERLALTEGCPRGSTVEERQSQSAVCTPGDAKGEGSQAHKEGICIGDGRKKVKTTGGKEFECDLLLLCTGQQPNSSLMAQLSPTSVDSRTRLVKVLRTLQVQIPTGKDGMAPQPFDPTPPCGDCDCFLDKKAAGTGEEGQAEAEAGGVQGCLGNVYAIGDVADAFGALNAGYQAWNMADVAAENIIRDIGQDAESSSATTTTRPTGEERHAKLMHYTPVGNMLKLSLGLGKMVFQGLPAEGGDGRPVIELKEDPHDLAVEGVWQFMAGMSTDDLHV